MNSDNRTVSIIEKDRDYYESTIIRSVSRKAIDNAIKKGFKFLMIWVTDKQLYSCFLIDINEKNIKFLEQNIKKVNEDSCNEDSIKLSCMKITLSNL